MSIQPVTHSQLAIEQAIEHSIDESKHVMERVVLSRLQLIKASFEMVLDAGRVFMSAARTCFQERKITRETLHLLFTSGKYLVASIAALVIGVFTPKGVLWIYNHCGLLKRVGLAIAITYKVIRFTQKHPYFMTAAAVGMGALTFYARSQWQQTETRPFVCLRVGDWTHPKNCT